MVTKPQHLRATHSFPKTVRPLGQHGDYARTLWEAGEKLLSGATGTSEELTNYGFECLRKGIQMNQSVAQAKDVTEALSAQIDHARTSVEDYLEETTKIMNITSKTTDEYWGRLWSALATTTHQEPGAD